MLANVFNAVDTASICIDAILKADSFDPGCRVSRIEKPEEWTEEKIKQRASLITSDKGPDGDFDD